MQTDIEKQALDKMIKARTHLLFDNPFIGANAIKYNLIPAIQHNGIKIETACINGKDIVFNPEYILSLSFNQVKFLLAHESWHCMLKHHIRRSGRDFETWNEAGDYVINDILMAENIGEKIDGILFDEKYNELNTEKVFKELYQEKQENNENNNQDNNNQSDDSSDDSSQSNDNSQENGSSGSNGDDSGQDDTDNGKQIASDPAGSVIDAPKDISHADIESEIKESIQSALNYARKAGKEPGQKVKHVLSEILAPSANWKQLLKQWIDSTDKTDVSFIRPKDRSNGYYSPGYYSEGLNQLVIAIDVSGSVLGYLNSIETFQSELNSLKQSYQFDCTLIYFHSNIERIETYQRHEDIKIEVIETGGTRIQPVFDHISDNGLINQISGLIVFTDLEIFDFPEQTPVFKTLFVKYGDSEHCEHAPIGETISID